MSKLELDVPYVSQEDDKNAIFAKDCGAACGLMFLKAYGKDPDGLTVNEFYIQAYPDGIIPIPKDKKLDLGLTLKDIQKVLKERYGLGTLEQSPKDIPGLIKILNEHKPVIVRVHYKPLVDAGYTSLEKNKDKGDWPHFMVVFGFDEGATPENPTLYVRDPENWRQNWLKNDNVTKIKSSDFKNVWSKPGYNSSGLYPIDPIPDASQLLINKGQISTPLPINPPVVVMPVVDPVNPPVVTIPFVDPGNPPVVVIPGVDPGNPPVPPIIGDNSVPYQVQAITGINVRSGPNYDFKTISYLQPLDVVTIIAENTEKTYGMLAKGQWITLNSKYVDRV